MNLSILKNLREKGLENEYGLIVSWVRSNSRLPTPTWNKLFLYYMKHMTYGASKDPDEWIKEQLEYEWAYTARRGLTQKEIDSLRDVGGFSPMPTFPDTSTSPVTTCRCSPSSLLGLGHDKDCEYIKGKGK